MPAAAATTIAAAEMVGGGKNHEAVLKIKIAGRKGGRGRAGSMPVCHTRLANAGLIAPIGRDLVEQGFGNFDLRAPAGAFIGRGGAELAVIGQAAQRAIGWGGAGRQRNHGEIVRISGRNRPMDSPGMRESREPGTGFSKST